MDNDNDLKNIIEISEDLFSEFEIDTFLQSKFGFESYALVLGGCHPLRLYCQVRLPALTSLFAEIIFNVDLLYIPEREPDLGKISLHFLYQSWDDKIWAWLLSNSGIN